jgi:hypothetical protein
MKLDDYAMDRGKPWCRRAENIVFSSFDIELKNIDSARRRLPKHFIHGQYLKLTTPCVCSEYLRARPHLDDLELSMVTTEHSSPHRRPGAIRFKIPLREISITARLENAAVRLGVKTKKNRCSVADIAAAIHNELGFSR